ncbi:methyltransferase TYW3-domain-containing protein [Hypoxylon rubiginosum]|uniref:Methyltransferase TYW3-domain-containing protein n=1 Tax=Hypoxylon rubiginosum TaxID=110542 RepID=A0ACC0CLM4_9PEZI|nr:methyltransferase TYW3-domain-containing protein [Hypoxylon rubiginosum]
MRGPTLPAPSPTFVQRKKRILEQLAVPDAEYTDSSPKGSVDAGIRDLIDEINSLAGFVTTSSCAGRVSVFLEGTKKQAGAGEAEDIGVEDGEARKLAAVGGKGGGGAWLFVSHDPVALLGSDAEDDGLMALLGFKGGPEKKDDTERITKGFNIGDIATTRFIHFKFEPMILHVLTASPNHAQLLLKCSLQAGFRESGAVSLAATTFAEHATPIVGIRSMGLAFESLIGFHEASDDSLHCTVSSDYLRTLVRIANDRFAENTKRIDRFRTALSEAMTPVVRTGDTGAGWEDAESRKERKKAEGLRRREELRGQQYQREGDTSTAMETEDTQLDMPLNTDFT